MRWTPEALAAALGARLAQRGSQDSIAGAFIDTRTPLPGGLFVPIVAARDGHDFMDAAVKAGAAAVLSEPDRAPVQGDVSVVEVPDTLAALQALARAARAERAQVPAVAITGSNGKTTTRAMVKGVLESAFDSVLSTRGNFNNHLGVPLSVLGEPHSPDAEVLELGMSALGENDLLASIVGPQVGIITSIALEHLEFMGSLEAIAKAEAELMGHIDAAGALVIPSDEPMLESLVPAEYAPRVLRVGPTHNADLQILEVEVGERTRAVIKMPSGERVSLRLKTFGAHNARNAAAALAVGYHLGLAVAPMVDALEAVDPVGDRGRLHTWGEHLVIADCYNANPGSMRVALESLAALRAQRAGPLVAVLGDMLELGPTQEELHRQVGELAVQLGIDLVIGVGELSRAIVQGAEGIEARFVGDDIEAAAAAIRATCREIPGAVLLKGSRGIRLERLLGVLGIDADPHDNET